jgi:hypothetical protein
LLSPAAALAAPYSGGAAPTGASSPGGVSPSSAAQGAFGVGLPQSSAPTPTQTQPVAPVVTTSSSSGGSLSGTDTLLIAVGAILVLGAIAYFIWSDSRHQVRLLRRAVPASAADGSPGRGSKARAKSRKLKPAERRRRKRGRAH